MIVLNTWQSTNTTLQVKLTFVKQEKLYRNAYIKQFVLRPLQYAHSQSQYQTSQYPY